jgi:hypothetical protein
MPLILGPENNLPTIKAEPAGAGALTFAPSTITFLTMPEAANPACK